MAIFKRNKPPVNPVTDVEVFEQEYPTLEVALAGEVSIGSQDTKATTFTFGERSLVVYTSVGVVKHITDSARPLQLPFALYWLSDELVSSEGLEQLQEAAGDNGDWAYPETVALAPTLTEQLQAIYRAQVTESALALLELFPTGPTTVRTELLSGVLADKLEKYDFYSTSLEDFVLNTKLVQLTVKRIVEERGLEDAAKVTLKATTTPFTPTTTEERFLLEAANNSSSLEEARKLSSGFLWADLLTALDRLITTGVLTAEGATPPVLEELPDLSTLQASPEEPAVITPVELEASPLSAAHEEESTPASEPVEAPAPQEEEAKPNAFAFLSVDDILADDPEEDATKPHGEGWGFQAIAPEDASAEEAFEPEDDGDFAFDEGPKLENQKLTGGLDVPLGDALVRVLHSSFMPEFEEHRLLQLQRQQDSLEEQVRELDGGLAEAQKAYFTQQLAHLSAIADGDDAPTDTSDAEAVQAAERKRFELNEERIVLLKQISDAVKTLHGEAVDQLQEAIATKLAGTRGLTTLVFVDPTPPEEPEETPEAVEAEELATELEEDAAFVAADEEPSSSTASGKLIQDLDRLEAEDAAHEELLETPVTPEPLTVTLPSDLLTAVAPEAPEPVIPVSEDEPVQEETVVETSEAEETPDAFVQELAEDFEEVVTPEEVAEEAAPEVLATPAPAEDEPETSEVIENPLEELEEATPALEEVSVEAPVPAEEDEHIYALETPQLEEPAEEVAAGDIATTVTADDFDPQETPIFARLLASRNFDPFTS